MRTGLEAAAQQTAYKTTDGSIAYSPCCVEKLKADNTQKKRYARFSSTASERKVPGSLGGVSGRFFENEVYNIAAEELEEFEKLFPAREKHITPTQLWNS